MKSQWIENLPVGWHVVPFGSLFQHSKNKNTLLKRDYVLSVMKNRGVIPYEEKGNIGNKVSDDLSGYKLVDKGDFVLNSMNLYVGSVGVSDYEGVTSTAYIVCKPSHEIHSGYYKYLIQSRGFQEYVGLLGNGILEIREAVRWTSLKSVKVPLPNIEIQRKIADFLDRKTTYIYQLIEKKEKLISLLIEKRKNIISSALTCRKEYNQNENVEKQIHQTFEKNIGTKEHWSKFRLKYLAQLVVDKVNFSDEDCPYIGLDAITQWTGEINLSTSDTVEESTGNRFYPGDILFGKLRPYLAKVATPNFLGQCSSEALVLRPYINVDTQFLRYRLVDVKTIDLINSSTYGTKMPRSSWDFIGNIYFNIPKLTTQKIIADFLNIETKKLDQTIKKTKKSIELLKEFRASLITAAVTGQLDVHKQKNNEALK